MGKQEIKQKTTRVETPDGVGNQLEQVFTVDDNSLPSPKELEEYKRIDPRIVDYLIESSIKEQAHRHKMDEMKIDVVNKSNRRVNGMNWWGMFFAFMCLLAFLALAAYALYLDKTWFASIFGIASVGSIVSIFVNKDNSINGK